MVNIKAYFSEQRLKFGFSLDSNFLEIRSFLHLIGRKYLEWIEKKNKDP